MWSTNLRKFSQISQSSISQSTISPDLTRSSIQTTVDEQASATDCSSDYLDEEFDKAVNELGTEANKSLYRINESSPKKKTVDSKYEKNLVLWASKLELETLDLKKTIGLKAKLLNDSYEKLHQEIVKFLKLSQTFEVSEIELQKIGRSFDEKIQKLKENVNEDLDAREATNRKFKSKTTKDINRLTEEVLSLEKQTKCDHLKREVMSEIERVEKSQEEHQTRVEGELASFSKSLKDLSQRQEEILSKIDLLQQLNQQKVDLPVTNTPISQTPQPDSFIISLPVTLTDAIHHKNQPLSTAPKKKRATKKRASKRAAKTASKTTTRTVTKAARRAATRTATKISEKRGKTKKSTSAIFVTRVNRDRRMLLSDSEIDFE